MFPNSGNGRAIGDRLAAGHNSLVAKGLLAPLAILAADVAAFGMAYKVVRAPFMAGSFFFYHADASGKIVGIGGSLDWFIIMAALLVACFGLKRHYTRRQPFWDDLRGVLGFSIGALIIDVALFYISGTAFPHAALPLFWGGMTAGVMALRQVARLGLSAAGLWNIPAALVGSGENAEQTLLALRDDHSMGFHITRAVALPGSPVSDSFKGLLEQANIPLEVMPREAVEQLAQQGLHLILSPEEEQLRLLRPVVDRLSLKPNRFDIVPPFRGLPLYGLDVTHLFGSEILLLRPRNNLARLAPRVLKRGMDVVGAVLLLTVSAPFMVAVALYIRSTGVRALLRIEKIGRNGKPFNCLKFQTMVDNPRDVLADLWTRQPEALRQWEKDFRLEDDPRVTSLGKFLRRTSLDNLPQLFHVLFGKMSLIGPRPLVAAEVARYGKQIAYYYQVAPGVSGLWQITGRHDTADYGRRVFMDIWYVKNWSLWLDMVILCKSGLDVVRRLVTK